MLDKLWDFITSDDRTDRLITRAALIGFVVLVYFAAAYLTLLAWIGIGALIIGFIILSIMNNKAFDRNAAERLRILKEDDGVTGYVKVRMEELEGAPWEARSRKESAMSDELRAMLEEKLADTGAAFPDPTVTKSEAASETLAADIEVTPAVPDPFLTPNDKNPLKSLIEGTASVMNSMSAEEESAAAEAAGGKDMLYAANIDRDEGVVLGSELRATLTVNTEKKIYTNFDDFVKSEKGTAERRPVPDRSDIDEAAKRRYEPEEVKIKTETYDKFMDLFPKKCITWDVVQNFKNYGENDIERAIGRCMFILLIATFNPAFVVGKFLMNLGDGHTAGDAFIFLSITLFMIGVFVVSTLFQTASYMLLLVGIILALKTYMFTWPFADACIGVAMFLLIYLLHGRMKRMEAQSANKGKPKL